MSDQTMFLDFGLFSVYWYGFLMGITVLLATGLFVFLRKMQGEDTESSMTTALVALPAALILSRVFYCWFAKALFSGGVWEMMNLLTGGYALYGALAGILTVVLAEGLWCGKSVIQMLDAVCPSVALAIAMEKWAGYINGSDIGFSVSSAWIQRFPFSVRSEADLGYNLWVGFFEGAAAMLIFLFLFVAFVMKDRKDCKGLRRGDIVLLFMMSFGFSQSFLESMRDDSLFMVTLGFVRINQIISIVMAVGALVFLMVRKGRRRGVSAIDVVLWLLCAAALGLAIYCEFTMNAVSMTRNYILLAISLSVMFTVGLCLMIGGWKHGAGKVGESAIDNNLGSDEEEKELERFIEIDIHGLDLDELKSFR